MGDQRRSAGPPAVRRPHTACLCCIAGTPSSAHNHTAFLSLCWHIELSDLACSVFACICADALQGQQHDGATVTVCIVCQFRCNWPCHMSGSQAPNNPWGTANGASAPAIPSPPPAASPKGRAYCLELFLLTCMQKARGAHRPDRASGMPFVCGDAVLPSVLRCSDICASACCWHVSLMNSFQAVVHWRRTCAPHDIACAALQHAHPISRLDALAEFVQRQRPCPRRLRPRSGHCRSQAHAMPRLSLAAGACC